MGDREAPPTAREHALFDAASQPAPQEFVRLCAMIGQGPLQVLDGFDSAPWRWLIVSFASAGTLSASDQAMRFPARIRARLDVTREYVERPWWRRLAR
jgi:hypothetical protein